ncbi:HAD-IA family hydrolase [Streptomyces sp. FXJ1.4098]|nr:HAD-IA family hydrolase [Streptomyces sp. FXJ1.4098]
MQRRAPARGSRSRAALCRGVGGQPHPRPSRNRGPGPEPPVRSRRHPGGRCTRQARPDLFLEVAWRIGVPPELCLAVEDAPDGIASALAAGMHVLRVVDGHLAPTGDRGEDTAGLPSGAGAPMPRGCALGQAAARSGPASVPAPPSADSDR